MIVVICNKCGKPMRNKSETGIKLESEFSVFHFCKECETRFWDWLEEGEKENFSIGGWQA